MSAVSYQPKHQARDANGVPLIAEPHDHIGRRRWSMAFPDLTTPDLFAVPSSIRTVRFARGDVL